VRRIQLTETVTRDGFGDRIVAHAGVVAVTATGMHHQAGAVYVYARGAPDGAMLVSAPDALPALVGAERQCTDGSVGAFDCSAVDLLAFVPSSLLRAPEHARGVRTNDNWGWTDPETGREYALVGRNDGTSFIDITEPTNPVLIGDLPKTPDTPPSQLWRDIKTYRDHAYIVADGAGDHGMQVFDLRRLRTVTDAPALFEPDVHYANVASVHNIAINEETGFAYLVGSRGGGETCGGGLHMVDIREPQNPQFAGCFRDERGTHDVQCVIYRGPDERFREREICLMSNGNAFAIADVTDKQSPRALSRASSPNAGYIHQGWTTEGDRYFIQDDEADVIQGGAETTRTLVWDLSDLEDPVLAREFMGSLPASAHNLYVKDRFAYQANYRYGLHVLDVSDPENPRETGTFDTTPFLEGPGFSGAWSTYPFFRSGTVIVTSVQEGLFLLKPRPRSPVF
jgi:choice-of-anchor B domain-containing protein